MMKKMMMMALPAALMFATGCPSPTPTPTGDGSTGDGPVTTDDGGTGDMVTSTGDMTFVIPPKPATTGGQIDRLGRGTINVAVTNPFDLDYTMQGAGATRDATRDAYNQDKDEMNWRTKWTPALKKTLAIYDGADTMCGNQFAAGMTVDMNRYNTLAGALADDRLYLNTDSGVCNQYLGVELNALGVANTDCGGRTPTFDVVDLMYTAATVGPAGFNMDGTFAITDGVTKEAEPQPATTFPYLTAPN
jgi:hypothetical protein